MADMNLHVYPGGVDFGFRRRDLFKSVAIRAVDDTPVYVTRVDASSGAVVVTIDHISDFQLNPSVPVVQPPSGYVIGTPSAALKALTIPVTPQPATVQVVVDSLAVQVEDATNLDVTLQDLQHFDITVED
jgi:hypothetical protein